MKLATMTQVTVDGVIQGNGPADVDHGNGFERGGWAMGTGDNQTRALSIQTYQRAGEMTLLIVPVVLGQARGCSPAAARTSRLTWPARELTRRA